MGSRNEIIEPAREIIIDSGNGVRLLGSYSQQRTGLSRGLIILIHGWEGSIDSTYIISASHYFFRRGFDIFRLNLRDHGKSHHLNQGLFHGALTNETAYAVSNIAKLSSDLPCYLIGFSLGGNFALRIALRQSDIPIPTLQRVFAISPALDPYISTLAIDKGLAVYRSYFLNKWKRSLLIKQSCFPDLYRFDQIIHHKTCLALTEAIMPWYPGLGHYRDYFRRYTLTGNALASLTMPVMIITAQDDPFLPVDDFRRLPRNPYLKISIQRYGGHCGFLDCFPFDCWYERQIIEIIEQGESG